MKLLAKETNKASETQQCASALLEVVPQVMQHLRMEMRKSCAADLSVPQFRALAFLHDHPDATLSAVAEHIGLLLPSMSKLVDGLVERGLVRRRVCREDRRCVLLRLTRRGESALELTHQSGRARLAEHLASLSASDLAVVEQAMGLLRSLFASARDEEERPAG